MAAGQYKHGHRLLAWRNLRLARCVLALPLVTIFLVFFAITASSDAAGSGSATNAARRELIAYLVHTRSTKPAFISGSKLTLPPTESASSCMPALARLERTRVNKFCVATPQASAKREGGRLTSGASQFLQHGR